MEEEKRHLDQQISSINHEQKNLLLQLQRLENRSISNTSDSETIAQESIPNESSRQIPIVYRERFERLILSQQITDEEPDDDIEKIIDELNQISLNEQALLDLIYRIIIRWNSSMIESKKLVCVSI